MAAVDDSRETSSKRLVLRVKRKRTDDPVEALVVSHIIPSKKAHILGGKEECDDKENSATVDQVFTLLGTFNEGDRLTSQHLLKDLKSKPLSHDNIKKKQKSGEELLTKLRQEKKVSHQDARFKLISRNRPDHVCDESATEANPPTSTEHTDSPDAADNEVQQLFNVYDVIKDEENTKERTILSDDNKPEDPNEIVCNSVKMIREKLNVREGNQPEYMIGEKGYVYDFYYADDFDKGLLGDVVEITGVNDHFTLETVDKEFDDMFGEDDDSNDESNWRNDYPDEDEYSSEEEQRNRRLPDVDFGFDIDDDDRKYHKKAFGEDLSDDDDDDDDDDDLDDYGKPCTLKVVPRSEVFNEELCDLDEGF